MNERNVTPNPDPVLRKEERSIDRRDDAEMYGLEPATPNDVVLGAEIGGVGGAIAGAVAGAALGAAGIVTGAVIGGVLGAAGSAAAVAVVDKIDDDSTPEEVGLEPAGEEMGIENKPTVPTFPVPKPPADPPPPPVELSFDRPKETAGTFDTIASDAMSGIERRQTK